MMRGGNRNMRRMIGKMGLDMKDISDVQEVIIRTSDSEILVRNPAVNRMQAKDSVIFTVTADDYEESELETPTLSEEDVQLVIQRANVDEARARSALTEANGEVAKAILILKTE